MIFTPQLLTIFLYIARFLIGQCCGLHLHTFPMDSLFFALDLGLGLGHLARPNVKDFGVQLVLLELYNFIGVLTTHFAFFLGCNIHT